MRPIFLILFSSIWLTAFGQKTFTVYQKGTIQISDDLTDTGRCCELVNGKYKFTVNLDKSGMAWKNGVDVLWVNKIYACLQVFTDEEFQSILFVPLSSKYKMQYFSAAKRSIIEMDSINNNVCYWGKVNDDSIQLVIQNLNSEKKKSVFLKSKKSEIGLTPLFGNVSSVKMGKDNVTIYSKLGNATLDIKSIY